MPNQGDQFQFNGITSGYPVMVADALSDNITNFSNGPWPIANYFIVWLTGALIARSTVPSQEWLISSGSEGMFINSGQANGANQDALLAYPTGTGVYAPGYFGSGVATQALAEAATTLNSTYYIHPGGNIGIVYQDIPAHGGSYADNATGSPSPTYTIIPYWPVGLVCAITTVSTPCGNALTGAALTWTTTTGATSYKIYRSATPGSGYTLIGTSATNSFTDTGLTYTAEYYYVITCVVNGYESPYSSEVNTGSPIILNAVTPSITNNAISYFSSGASLAPGMYCITFLTGSYGLGQSNLWTVNQNKDVIYGSRSQAFKITNGIDTIDGPGNYDSYATQSQCASVNLAKCVYFYHDYNKPIGMYLNDFNYANNIAGSPNPTFLICGPWAFGKLTVDHATIAPGATAVITWSITGTTDTQDINGTPIVGASGTLSVTPASSTRYLMTLTRFGMAFTTYIDVTVTRPSAPAGFAAVPSCSGNVALSWNAPSNATQTQVYRGAVTGGPYTLITTVSAATVTYTDAIPVAANTYFYIIRHYDGTNYSVYGGEYSASSILPLTAPGSLSAILSQGQPRLLWTPVTGAISYTVYRSTTAGTETSYATGILTAFFQDSGCVNGQQYFYTVAAVNSCGPGAQTAEIPITALSNVTTMTH